MGLLSLIRKKGHYTSGLRFLIKFLFILNGLNSFTLPVTGSRAASKVHIIYMGEKQQNDPDRFTESHHEMLASVLGSKEAAMDAMVYSYRHGFSGFAAKLTESQAQKFKGLPGVVDVMPNHFYSLKTTRSWDYLGQSLSSSNNLLRQAKMGDGIIVGLFDSGVWPESEGYNDEGLGPIPARWKGRCISGDQFDAKTHCNRKLIGAKWFADGLLAEYPDLFKNTTDFQSTRDSNGHGTHTSTTAAGSLVHNASYKGGLAGGIARGGAPHARIAMYKVGWETPETVNGISAADILKAFDEAIHDGVDVLSLSIGDEVPFYSDVDHRDGIQIGAFHAVAKGIPVVCSAGNEGPAAQTVGDTSPWILNVAATTLDRSFPTGITLGNNMTILGQSLFVGKQIGFTSLVHPELPEGFKPISYCETLILSLNFTSVDGKVVLCFAKTSDPSVVSTAEETLQAAGAVGLIVGRNPPISAITPPLKSTFPSVLVDYELATQILLYIRSTRSPAVKISPAKTLTGKPVATVVAHFSCRGPSSISPAILKPDVAAPGVSIVAGSAPFDEFYYNGFALQTGTSMACPHVAGIVALLRAIHPTWSPAAIKSAIITTASKTDPHGEPIFAETSSKKLATPFDFGGGLVNPDKAAYPGLVYDMAINDYIHYLCAQNYNSSSISMLVGYKITCPQGTLSVLDVNYPAFTIPSLKHSVTVTRTVTNVGPVNSVYKVVIDPPAGYNVIVTPKVLVFNGSTKRASFKVTFTTTHKKNSGYYFGSLTWSDGVHTVASPISVRTQILESFIDDY